MAGLERSAQNWSVCKEFRLLIAACIILSHTGEYCVAQDWQLLDDEALSEASILRLV